MTKTTYSINNVPIRLTDERWIHIVENRDELAGHYYEVLEAVLEPDYVFEGNRNELWAAKFVSANKLLLVIYKEEKQKKDGFILTAYFTTKINKLFKRKILWKRKR